LRNVFNYEEFEEQSLKSPNFHIAQRIETWLLKQDADLYLY